MGRVLGWLGVRVVGFDGEGGKGNGMGMVVGGEGLGEEFVEGNLVFEEGGFWEVDANVLDLSIQKC